MPVIKLRTKKSKTVKPVFCDLFLVFREEMNGFALECYDNAMMTDTFYCLQAWFYSICIYNKTLNSLLQIFEIKFSFFPNLSVYIWG